MVVATDAFLELAREAASAQGLPNARIATVAHPIGGISDTELAARAESLVDEVLELFVATNR